MYTGFGGFLFVSFRIFFTVFYLAISLEFLVEFFENDCASGVCFA